MKIAKNILRYIITIILSLSIICLVLVNIASSTVLNENYILDKLDKTSYYSKIYEEAKSNFENYIYQSGLDESVLENVITQEKVENDTKKVISNIFNGLEETVDTQEIKDNLNKNIEKSVGKLNITQQRAVDTLIEKICEEYTDTISHFSYEKQIFNIYQKALKYIQLAQKATLIAIGVSAILLILINLRRIYKIFVFIGIALTSSSIFFIITNGIINAKVKIQTITILNDAVSYTLRDVLSSILQTINQYGIILLVTGIILVIIANLIHNIFKAKYTKENENS